MARPPRIEVAGGVYHVVARGNERRDIFCDDADRRRYLARLADCRARLNFFLYAYCLMNNHVHLVVERGDVPLSRVVHRLHFFHSQKFNRRHERVGHVFQGRYKAFLVDHERYFFTLLRYVHDNPVKAGIVRNPSRFRWSSDRFYRAGAGPDWLDLGRALVLLGSTRSEAIARYRRGGRVVPAYENARPVAAVIKGDDAFAERALRLAGKPEPRAWRTEQIARAVSQVENVDLAVLRGRRQGGGLSRMRAIAGYLAGREAGIPIARMASFLGRDESTLIKGVLELERVLPGDAVLRARVGAARDRVSLISKNSGFQG